MQAQLGKLEIADRHARHIAQSLFHIRDIEFVCGDCAVELEQGMEQIIRELQADNNHLKSATTRTAAMTIAVASIYAIQKS